MIKERTLEVIQFRILFNIRQLNIRKLTEEMQVSRHSIQNNLDMIKQEFFQYGINAKNRSCYVEDKKQINENMHLNRAKKVL